MDLDVAVVDLTDGYGGPGLALANRLRIPAVGFVPQAPSAALVESTVLKEQFAHDPNRFALFPMEPATTVERLWALANKAVVNWNVAKDIDEIDNAIKSALPDSPPVSGKLFLKILDIYISTILLIFLTRFTSQPERHADQRQSRVELRVLPAADFRQDDGSAPLGRAGTIAQGTRIYLYGSRFP